MKNYRSRRVLTAIALAIALLLAVFPVALAKTEDATDLPRVASAGNIRVEILAPAHDGTQAGSDIVFRFKVTDLSGQPLDNANLSFLATRDYSGQVKKEFNGPHDPQVGPYPLIPAGKPGEYTVTANFWHNGHWQLALSGPDLKEQTLRYTQSVGADPADGTGFSWDWLIWPGGLLAVLLATVIATRKVVRFPVPAEEVSDLVEETKEPVVAGGK